MCSHFDLLAPLYDRLMPPPDAAHLRAFLRLPTDGWLLDIGGGTGRVSTSLRPWVGKLVISDLSQPMLKQAQAKGNLYPIQARAEQLPFSDSTLDRILVVDAFHHFADQPSAAYELVRVLKPGGRLVIEEPDIAYLATKLIALGEKLALMRSRFLSADEMRAMFIARGTSVSIERGNGITMWVVVDK